MAILAFLPHLVWILLLGATLTVLVPHFLVSLPEIESNNPGECSQFNKLSLVQHQIPLTPSSPWHILLICALWVSGSFVGSLIPPLSAQLVPT